jgi:hypothetical protein
LNPGRHTTYHDWDCFSSDRLKNSRRVSGVGHYSFHSKPFAIHPSSYESTLHSLSPDSDIKQATKILQYKTDEMELTFLKALILCRKGKNPAHRSLLARVELHFLSAIHIVPGRFLFPFRHPHWSGSLSISFPPFPFAWVALHFLHLVREDVTRGLMTDASSRQKGRPISINPLLRITGVLDFVHRPVF